MTRAVSGATHVRQWLKRAMKSKIFEFCKFYSSKDLFDIYKVNNLIKDTISEEKEIVHYLKDSLLGT